MKKYYDYIPLKEGETEDDIIEDMKKSFDDIHYRMLHGKPIELSPEALKNADEIIECLNKKNNV